MPIYSEPISDEKILKDLTDMNNVLIIGCGSCANVSYNILEGGNEPFTNILKKPFSISKEINRLKELLTEKRFSVDSTVNNGLCVKSKKVKKTITAAKKFDALLILSCTAGVQTFIDLNKHKKIIHGMRVKGFKSIGLKIKGVNIYLNKTY